MPSSCVRKYLRNQFKLFIQVIHPRWFIPWMYPVIIILHKYFCILRRKNRWITWHFRLFDSYVSEFSHKNRLGQWILIEVVFYGLMIPWNGLSIKCCISDIFEASLFFENYWFHTNLKNFFHSFWLSNSLITNFTVSSRNFICI